MTYSSNPIYLNSDGFEAKIVEAISTKALVIEYYSEKDDVLLLEMSDEEKVNFCVEFPDAELIPAFYQKFNEPTLLEFKVDDVSAFFKRIICPIPYALLRAPENPRSRFTFHEKSDENTFTVFVKQQTLSFAEGLEYEEIDLQRLKITHNGEEIDLSRINIKENPQKGVEFSLLPGKFVLHFGQLNDLQAYFTAEIDKNSPFRVLIREEELLELLEYEGNELISKDEELCIDVRVSLLADSSTPFALAIEAPSALVLRKNGFNGQISKYTLPNPLISIEQTQEEKSVEAFPLLEEQLGTSYNDMLHYFRLLKIREMSVLMLKNIELKDLPEELARYQHNEQAGVIVMLVPDDETEEFYAFESRQNATLEIQQI